MGADLSHGPLGPEEAAQEVEGHTQHGGEREAPAHGFAPPRVHVGVVVDERLVVHDVEDEDALRGRSLAVSWQQPPRALGAPCPAWPPRTLTMHTSGVKKDQHHFIQGQGRYPIMQATSSMKRSAPGGREPRGPELETQHPWAVLRPWLAPWPRPTVHPGDHHALPEGLPEQGRAAGRVVVEQLEDIHPTLGTEPGQGRWPSAA